MTAVGDRHAELDDLRRRLAELELRQVELLRSKPRPRGAGKRTKVVVGALCAAGLLAASGLLHSQGVSEALALFIDSYGRVGIGTRDPKASLDVAGTLSVGSNATLASASVKGRLNVDDTATLSSANVKGSLGVEGRATLSSASIQGPLTVADKLVVGTTGSGAHLNLDVNGVLRASVVEATTSLRNRMYPSDALVYQDIFDAKAKGIVALLGKPAFNDSSFTRNNPWQRRSIIQFGGNNEADGNGVKVSIPEGYDTLWIRVLGDRWNVVHAYFLDRDQRDLGNWTGGHRSANSYGPDGSLTDGDRSVHQWVPIPVGRDGKLALVSKTGTDHEFWLSGIAFSRNPWAHAAQSAVGYLWKVNGGDGTGWGGDDVKGGNGDSLARIDGNTKLELKVPVVPSGRDKLLYLVAHNDQWNGAMHNGITVNGQPIERFLASYDNPFARHWNSKLYERYIAARIPAGLIRENDRYLSVRIDMSKQDGSIGFREIGTHDLDVPWRDGPSTVAAQQLGR